MRKIRVEKYVGLYNACHISSPQQCKEETLLEHRLDLQLWFMRFDMIVFYGLPHMSLVTH